MSQVRGSNRTPIHTGCRAEEINTSNNNNNIVIKSMMVSCVNVPCSASKTCVQSRIFIFHGLEGKTGTRIMSHESSIRTFTAE